MSRRTIRTAVQTLALTGLLAGCSFAPEYNKPDVAEPPAVYKEAGDWKLAQPADGQPRGAWWKMFGDAQLDALEAQVGNANQDIKAAFARLQQARAGTRVQRAALFPTVTAGVRDNRTRTSANSPGFAPGQVSVNNDFVADVDVSYEVDLWGRVRNTVTQARAGEQASAADFATLDLSSHAELASDYFALRGADREQILLDRTVTDYTKAVQLEQNLFQGGAIAVSDLAQAQAQLETARTLAEDTRLQRAQFEHSIAVLVGANAAQFHIDALPMPADAAPPAIDPGLPSALLERRPDIASAERHVAAANAGIGVARAAYFPVFGLTASRGYESTDTSNWFDKPSRIWSFGPSVLLTLFDAGRHDALSDQARSAYDETVANYRGSVLNAYREVEDNLAALHQLDLESRSQSAAVAATQKTLQQANYRYKGGATTYLEVVVSENAALQAEISAANIQTRRMNASVLLMKALGGGWQPSQLQLGDSSSAGEADASMMKPATQ